MTESRQPKTWPCIAALVYVAAVLTIDTFVLHGAVLGLDWTALRLRWHGMDLFKFVAWFVIPFAACAAFMDWGYFGFGRWKRIDWMLLGTVAGIGGGIMLALPWLPEVGDVYRGWGARPFEQRVDLAAQHLLWTLSWLTGWEFMHRYVLVRPVLERYPIWGSRALLVIVPVYEVGYHVIQGKPVIECIGMGALSLLFTGWVVVRRNALLPFLGHLAIEIELIVYLFLAD